MRRIFARRWASRGHQKAKKMEIYNYSINDISYTKIIELSPVYNPIHGVNVIDENR